MSIMPGSIPTTSSKLPSITSKLYSEYLDTGKQDIEGFKTFIQQQGSVKLGVAESADKAKPLGLQLDLDAITANIANELKENIITKGLGATFNIEESADSSIDENIPKGKQNSCK